MEKFKLFKADTIFVFDVRNHMKILKNFFLALLVELIITGSLVYVGFLIKIEHPTLSSLLFSIAAMFFGLIGIIIYHLLDADNTKIVEKI